jgi:enamine deaminase RidA (YjgF/YER057c/UK114 family)
MRLIPVFALVLLTAAPSLAQAPVRAAVKSDGLVYLSGVVAAGPDVTMQTAAAIEKIAATLKAEGSTLANVANVSVVLKSATDMAGLNTVFAKYWPKDPPARTTIIVDQPLTSAGALVELSVTAIPTGGERIVVQPGGWLAPPGPYSYGIKTGNTLFLAGLVSRNGVDNTNVTGDMTVQTRTVMTMAAAILEAAGMSLADVVSSRVFIADAAGFQTMNTEYRTHFPTDPPARATAKATLPSTDYLVEIAMVAVKDPHRKQIVPPNADGTPGRAGANLSPAIQVGRRLYVAGMTGGTESNKGDVAAQTTEMMTRLGRALTAAGYTWSDVVEATAFLPDMTRIAEMDTAYRAVFTKEFPVRFTMGTPLMGADAIVEIMLTAVK